MNQSTGADIRQRRTFVAALGGMVSLGAVAPLCVMAATPGTLVARDVDLSAGFSRVKFEALLNQTFFIETRDLGHVMVRLIAVQPKKNTKAPLTSLDQFSLLFRGLLLPSLPSGLYDVSHLSAGRFQLRLQTLPLQRSQPMYRADFSLLPSPAPAL